MAAFLFSFPACVLAALALDRVATASSWMYVFWAGVTPDKLQALEAALPWLSRGALLVGMIVIAGSGAADHRRHLAYRPPLSAV